MTLMFWGNLYVVGFWENLLSGVVVTGNTRSQIPKMPSAQLAMYPWGRMPLRRCIDATFDSFPTHVKQVMAPMIAMQKKDHSSYRYVSCESKGKGMQVQWYDPSTKRLKRLAKVTDPVVGALARAAAVLDPRLRCDDGRLYESAMRWLDWLLAMDIQDTTLRTKASDVRGRVWVNDVYRSTYGALHLMALSTGHNDLMILASA